MIEAAEEADKDEVDRVVATFLAAVERQAKNISDRYIVPPNTTDFAIMFLPTEGLYAEVLRAPGSSAHCFTSTELSLPDLRRLPLF